MSFLDDLQNQFRTRDLYEILGVSHNASDTQLKSGYKRAALRYHPDRVGKDKKPEATTYFQLISKVYAILRDKDKRNHYDETGSVTEEDFYYENNHDWAQYFRNLFPRVTRHDIYAFMEKYKGSDEELEDLKKCYLRYEGDMHKISQSFIGYEVYEDEKIANMLKELIKKREIPEFPQFMKEDASKRNARIKRHLREAKQAASLSLADEIKQRSEVREEMFNNMIRNLEIKYCPNQRKEKITPDKRAVRGSEKVNKEKRRQELTIREKRRKQFQCLIKALERKYVRHIKRNKK